MRIRKTCQQEIFNSLNPHPVAVIAQNPEKFFSNFSKTQLRALDYLFHLQSTHTHIFPSQTHIANKIGCVRETANRILSRFEDWGLLVSNYHHLHSKEYRISSYFRNPYIRARLSKIFSGIKIVPLYMIFSAPSLSEPKNVTQILFEDIYSNSLYTDTTKKGGIHMSSFDRWNSATTNTNKLFASSATDVAPEIVKKSFKNMGKKGNVNEKAFISRGVSDNAYYATYKTPINKAFSSNKLQLETVYHNPEDSTSRSHSSFQAENKYQKQEQRSPYGAVNKPNLANVVLSNAKKLYEEAQTGRRSRFYVKNALKRWAEDYPQGVPNFNVWYNSAEAISFKQWLETDSQ